MSHEFEIAQSDARGGKAGRGRNKTATIQVRERLMGPNYLLLHQVTYQVRKPGAREAAVVEAHKWGEAEMLRRAKTKRKCGE